MLEIDNIIHLKSKVVIMLQSQKDKDWFKECLDNNELIENLKI